MKHLFILVLLAGLFWLPQSYAGVQFALQGAADVNSSGYGFASSPSLLLGGQLTMDVGYPYQVGLAYEHNNLSYGTDDSGELKFYGVVGRIKTLSPFYFDAQAGIATRDSNGPSFSWGVGSGYIFPLMSSIDFAPRIGYRFVPDSGIERSLIDLGVMLTFKFN
jgi:hypothetical protein